MSPMQGGSAALVTAILFLVPRETLTLILSHPIAVIRVS